MKNAYTLIFTLVGLAFAGNAAGQFTFSSNEIVLSDFEFTDIEVVAYGTVFNNSGNFLQLTWERTELEIPDAWTSQICDNFACYLPHVSTKEFTIPPDTSSPMDVHIRPNGTEGTALIKVNVWVTATPTVADSAYYYFDREATSVGERLEEALKIYPNPVRDAFHVENGGDVSRIEIHDVQGRLVKTFDGVGHTGLSIAELGPGYYIVRMYGADNTRLSGNLLVKQ